MVFRIGRGRLRLVGLACAAAFAGMASAALAAGPTTIRVANFTNSATLPLYYGIDNGYFKEAGLDIQIVKVATGAAAVSAVASGQADIAWAASAVPIFARAKGVKVKMFATASDDGPEHWGLSIDASARSGITSFPGMKGKTVMINAFGTATELAIRLRLQRAGVKWDEVKKIVVPFPQMPAALELGNADVAVTIEPMQAQIEANKAIGAKVLDHAVLPESHKAPVTASSFFATDAWLAKNQAAAIAFGRAYLRGAKEIQTNGTLRTELLVKYNGMQPDMAKKMPDPTWFSNIAITRAAVEPNYKTLVESGMLEGHLNVEDVIATLPY